MADDPIGIADNVRLNQLILEYGGTNSYAENLVDSNIDPAKYSSVFTLLGSSVVNNDTVTIGIFMNDLVSAPAAHRKALLDDILGKHNGTDTPIVPENFTESLDAVLADFESGLSVDPTEVVGDFQVPVFSPFVDDATAFGANQNITINGADVSINVDAIEGTPYEELEAKYIGRIYDNKNKVVLPQSKKLALVVDGVASEVDDIAAYEKLSYQEQVLYRSLEQRSNSQQQKVIFGSGYVNGSSSALRSTPYTVDSTHFKNFGGWPREFLEERMKRWKYIFVKKVVEWMRSSISRLRARLLRKGWASVDPLDADKTFDPSLPGNDVRENCCNYYVRYVVVPIVNMQRKLIREQLDMFDFPVTMEEAKSYLFQYLSIKLSYYRYIVESRRGVYNTNNPLLLYEQRAKTLKNVLLMFNSEGAYTKWYEEWFSSVAMLTRATPAVSISHEIAGIMDNNELPWLNGNGSGDRITMSDQHIMQKYAVYLVSIEEFMRVLYGLSMHKESNKMADTSLQETKLKTLMTSIVQQSNLKNKAPMNNLHGYIVAEYYIRTVLGRDTSAAVNAIYRTIYEDLALMIAFPSPVYSDILEDIKHDQRAIMKYVTSMDSSVVDPPDVDVMEAVYQNIVRYYIPTITDDDGNLSNRFVIRNTMELMRCFFEQYTYTDTLLPKFNQPNVISDTEMTESSMKYTLERIRRDLSHLLNKKKQVPLHIERKKLNDSPVVLTARLAHVPIRALVYNFTWIHVSTSLVKRVLQQDMNLTWNSGLTSTLKINNVESGEYYCDVVGVDAAAGVEAAQGRSMSATVRILGTCTRCGNEFDLDDLSESCKWRVDVNELELTQRRLASTAQEADYDMLKMLEHMMLVTLVHIVPSDPEDILLFDEETNYNYQVIWQTFADPENYIGKIYTQDHTESDVINYVIPNLLRVCPYRCILDALISFYEFMRVKKPVDKIDLDRETVEVRLASLKEMHFSYYGILNALSTRVIKVDSSNIKVSIHDMLVSDLVPNLYTVENGMSGIVLTSKTNRNPRGGRFNKDGTIDYFRPTAPYPMTPSHDNLLYAINTKRNRKLPFIRDDVDSDLMDIHEHNNTSYGSGNKTSQQFYQRQAIMNTYIGRHSETMMAPDRLLLVSDMGLVRGDVPITQDYVNSLLASSLRLISGSVRENSGYHMECMRTDIKSLFNDKFMKNPTPFLLSSLIDMINRYNTVLTSTIIG
jgi:hypothetical protein